jgi:hypothetical protein
MFNFPATLGNHIYAVKNLHWMGKTKVCSAGRIYRVFMEFNPEEYLYKLSKIVDSTSILVIDRNGKLRRIYCPFLVEALVKFQNLCQGEVYVVDAVKVTLTLDDVFIIKGKAYLIGYFRIMG